MDIWSRIKDDEVVKFGWRTLVKKTFKQPDGKSAEYITKEAVGTVCCAVLALTKNNQVVIAKQFRQGPEKVMHELPGGRADFGELPQDAALRELVEETGYVPESVEYLGKLYKDAYSNATFYYYLGLGCTDSGNQKLDSGEFIDVELISISQLFDNAKNGKMCDTDAIFLAYEKLKEAQGGKI